jgi:hypothetical protein
MVAALLVLTACGGRDWEVAGGQPRFPSAAGVVLDITPREVTLDGDRTFPFADEIASFSTYTLEPLPLSHRVGQFVHLGLADGRVEWIATIGVVSGDPPRVIYTGDLLGVDDGRGVFADGTALPIGDGVEVPEGGFVDTRIDPESGAIVELTVP